MHGDHVGVAFHQVTFILPDDLRLGQVQAIKHIAFIVYFRLGGINILWFILFFGQDTSAKTDYPARKVIDREYDPGPEPIVSLFIVTLNGQPGLNKILQLIPVCHAMFGECIPFFGAVSQPELFDDILIVVPLLEIRQAYRLSFIRFKQLLMKIFLGKCINMEEGLPLIHFLLLLGALFCFLYLDTILPGKESKGFGIGKVFMLHQESNHTTSFI